MTAEIVAAAYAYVAARDAHRQHGSLLSAVKAAHQQPIDAVRAAGPLVDWPDQTCQACGQEHPGAECQQPSLWEVSD